VRVFGWDNVGLAEEPAGLDSKIYRFALGIGPQAGELSDFFAVLVDDVVINVLLKISLCCSAHMIVCDNYFP
jgi:hypothetical protein